MALRVSARVLREAAGKSGGSAPAGGLLQDIRKRISTQKFLRPDVEDDILRQPVDQAKYRFPSPGYVPFSFRSNFTHASTWLIVRAVQRASG